MKVLKDNTFRSALIDVQSSEAGEGDLKEVPPPDYPSPSPCRG